MKWFYIVLVVLSLAQAQQDPNTAPPAPTLQEGEEAAPAMQLYPESAIQLTQFAEVAQAIATAGSEVMLATDVLRSEEIAEALRAAVMRGVAVYIITPTENIEDPSSYLVSLALAGANIRLAPVEGSFVTIDRTNVVVGVLVSGVMGLPGQEEMDRTILVPDETYTAPYVDTFYKSFEVAPALDPATLAILQPDQGGQQ